MGQEEEYSRSSLYELDTIDFNHAMHPGPAIAYELESLDSPGSFGSLFDNNTDPVL